MGARARLAGLRKDGASVPVEISLGPVPTATGFYVLAVIRDPLEARRRADLAELARSAAAGQSHRVRELLDRVADATIRTFLTRVAAQLADPPAEGPQPLSQPGAHPGTTRPAR